MKDKNLSPAFHRENASSYDNQTAKLAAIKDSLHLFMRVILSDLPIEARILCIGVGTGSELIYLAKKFPQWHFTAVEPSQSMLNICRQKAEEIGISSRCSFHEGYLDSLPSSDCFDAATSILVSHFIMRSEQRGNFFSEIAVRLRPGAYLINADLAADMSSPEYENLLEVWLKLQKYSGMPANPDSFGRSIALLPKEKIESILTSNGFDTPILFFQNLLIHAWFSRVRS